MFYIWFVFTLGVSYFARSLWFRLFDLPFSFWSGAQGAPDVFVAIVGFYAWYMNRLDLQHGAQVEGAD